MDTWSLPACLPPCLYYALFVHESNVGQHGISQSMLLLRATRLDSTHEMSELSKEEQVWAVKTIQFKIQCIRVTVMGHQAGRQAGRRMGSSTHGDNRNNMQSLFYSTRLDSAKLLAVSEWWQQEGERAQHCTLNRLSLVVIHMNKHCHHHHRTTMDVDVVDVDVCILDLLSWGYILANL